MKTIYIFSGLGADERVFQDINFGNYSPHFIAWVEPLNNETLSAYSKRIEENIADPNSIVLGVSFGGIVAQEIAKHRKVEKLILLATFEQRNDLPWYLRLLGNLKADKLVPAALLKTHTWFSDYLFGIKIKSHSIILKDILVKTDATFLKWCLRQICIWKPEVLHNVKQKITIHGTADRIIPLNKSKQYDYEIEGGGHLFTLSHAAEISAIIQG
jgi:pimeloyl-ACP methyl ester carboxylesterase